MEDQGQTPNNQNVQPTPTIPSVRREIEVASRPVAEASSIAHSEKAPVLSEEVQKAGVEVTPFSKPLTKAHLDVGIRPSPSESLPDLSNIENDLPISRAEAVLEAKRDEGDSVKWYATLIEKLYKIRDMLKPKNRQSVTV